MIGVPISVPFGGVAGFTLLQKRMDDNLNLIAGAPQVTRELDYFQEHIRDAATPEALLKDYRLTKVVLTAYGLQDEIGKTAFLKRILSEGTDDPNSFVNRLREPRFQALAKGLGYGNIGGKRTLLSKFQNEIETGFLRQTLEEAVGTSDANLRLALNFQRRIETIATGPSVENAGWFQIMGELPLRRVVEGAFGLPNSFALLDIDRQRETLADRSRALFGGTGSPAAFAKSENADKLLRRFLALAPSGGNSGGAAASGSGALALLSAIAGGGAGNGVSAASLLLARA
jgi:hypothetical protein